MNAAADRIRWHLATEVEANEERPAPEQDCAESIYTMLVQGPMVPSRIIEALRVAYLRGTTDTLESNLARMGTP